MKGLVTTITLLTAAAASVHATPSVCQTAGSKEMPRGCLCDPGGQYSTCADGLECTGNKTEYDSGYCGGFDGIDCPREAGAAYVDFWIQNSTTDYCANTQIRTCSDGNGCVGVRVRGTACVSLVLPRSDSHSCVCLCGAG